MSPKTSKVRLVWRAAGVAAVVAAGVFAAASVETSFDIGSGIVVHKTTILGYSCMTSTESTGVSDFMSRVAFAQAPRQYVLDRRSAVSMVVDQCLGGYRRPSTEAQRLQSQYVAMVGFLTASDVDRETCKGLLERGYLEASRTGCITTTCDDAVKEFGGVHDGSEMGP